MRMETPIRFPLSLCALKSTIDFPGARIIDRLGKEQASWRIAQGERAARKGEREGRE